MRLDLVVHVIFHFRMQNDSVGFLCAQCYGVMNTSINVIVLCFTQVCTTWFEYQGTKGRSSFKPTTSSSYRIGYLKALQDATLK